MLCKMPPYVKIFTDISPSASVYRSTALPSISPNADFVIFVITFSLILIFKLYFSPALHKVTGMKRNWLPVAGMLFLIAVFFAAAGGLLLFKTPPLSDLPASPVIGAFRLFV